MHKSSAQSTPYEQLTGVTGFTFAVVELLWAHEIKSI